MSLWSKCVAAFILLLMPVGDACAAYDQNLLHDDVSRGFAARVERSLGRVTPDVSNEYREGAIFTQGLARAFKLMIAVAADRRGRSLHALTDDHDCREGIRAVVNQRMPFDASHYVSPVLLAALPVMPRQVEYRVVGHDLVLWNVSEDIVLDVLRSVFAAVAA